MKIIFLGMLLCLGVTLASAQEKKEFRYTISYLSASLVYIDAGREQHIAVGDTLTVVRGEKMLGAVAVTAISNHSCAAQILSQQTPFAVGDRAAIRKYAAVEKTDTLKRSIAQDPKDSSSAVRSATVPPAAAEPSPSTVNVISGRVGLQYAGVIAEDTRFNLSQPSALFRLEVANVVGTGTMFSMYSRNYYDLSKTYNRYGETSRLKNRIYELSLQRDVPESMFGFGLGRMTSRYVGGLGMFDGGQAFVRFNNITAGVLVGAKVADLTMGLDGEDKKGAAFVNYHYGTDFLHSYDGTFAYGRQLIKNRLDREFLYLQNSLMLGSDLSLYESTEIELNDITQGVITRAFRLSNTFLSVNYYPVQWFSTNVGYDATRSVYLFESMKAFPDTLLDKNIMQGFRAGTNFRFPYYISLSLNGTYRMKKGDWRPSHNVSATLRMYNIAGTDINADLRAANIVGVYTDGNNFTFDLDRTFFQTLSVSLRYDHYSYTINTLMQSYVTQTMTANINYRLSRALYLSLNVDRVVDATMNSYRTYGEVGIRF